VVTQVVLYETKWFHNSDDQNFNFNHSENLTTHVQNEL
jgi:hypothetical protein